MKKGNFFLLCGWLSACVGCGFVNWARAYPVSFHILKKEVKGEVRQVGIIGVDYKSDGSNGGNGDDERYAQFINEVMRVQEEHKLQNNLSTTEFFLDVPFSFDCFSSESSHATSFSFQLVTKYLKDKKNGFGSFRFLPTNFELNKEDYKHILALANFLDLVAKETKREHAVTNNLKTIYFYACWCNALLNFLKDAKLQLLMKTFSEYTPQDSALCIDDEACKKMAVPFKKVMNETVPLVNILHSQERVRNTILVWGDSFVPAIKKLLVTDGYKEAKVKQEKKIGPEKLQAFITYFIRCCNFCGKYVKAKRGCGRCKNVRYCDRSCQVGDWKSHKKFCDSV